MPLLTRHYRLAEVSSGHVLGTIKCSKRGLLREVLCARGGILEGMIAEALDTEYETGVAAPYVS